MNSQIFEVDKEKKEFHSSFLQPCHSFFAEKSFNSTPESGYILSILSSLFTINFIDKIE
jgi:hypothetical protein